MNALRHEAEQFTMPMPVALAKPTLGQMRERRDALIERLGVLAGHRNQVVQIPRERLEQIACVAVCALASAQSAPGEGALQMDWFLANEPAVQWSRSLPSRRWRERLHRLRVLGEAVAVAEMQAAPNAHRLSVPPPPRSRPLRRRRNSFPNEPNPTNTWPLN